MSRSDRDLRDRDGTYWVAVLTILFVMGFLTGFVVVSLLRWRHG